MTLEKSRFPGSVMCLLCPILLYSLTTSWGFSESLGNMFYFIFSKVYSVLRELIYKIFLIKRIQTELFVLLGSGPLFLKKPKTYSFTCQWRKFHLIYAELSYFHSFRNVNIILSEVVFLSYRSLLLYFRGFKKFYFECKKAHSSTKWKLYEI